MPTHAERNIEFEALGNGVVSMHSCVMRMGWTREMAIDRWEREMHEFKLSDSRRDGEINNSRQQIHSLDFYRYVLQLPYAVNTSHFLLRIFGFCSGLLPDNGRSTHSATAGDGQNRNRPYR